MAPLHNFLQLPGCKGRRKDATRLVPQLRLGSMHSLRGIETQTRHLPSMACCSKHLP